jgi:hypothetical protein
MSQSFNCNSQNNENYWTIENRYQDCLNEWKKYENCSIRYYNQSDSLRLAYKKKT